VPIAIRHSRTCLVAAGCLLAVGLTASCSSASDTATATTPTSSTGMSSQSAGPSTIATTITIKDFAFTVPASVPAGATVTVMNMDDMKHTVTASGAGGFDVTIDANGTGTFTAPAKPGTYPFVCSFHGNMKATLVVR
jgi:plastocyanin